jgi:hypothetical protein
VGRLINYGTGDVLDRLTVLALKELHYGAAGKDTAHLRDERNALLPKLYTKELPKPALEALLALGAVNSSLWALTDQLRVIQALNQKAPLHSSHIEDAARLGMRIMELNDTRAELVETINKLTGEHRGNEKG